MEMEAQPRAWDAGLGNYIRAKIQRILMNGDGGRALPAAGELTILVGWEIRKVMGMEAGNAGQLMNWMRCSQSHVPSTMDAARVCCGARTKATMYTIKRM